MWEREGRGPVPTLTHNPSPVALQIHTITARESCNGEYWEDTVDNVYLSVFVVEDCANLELSEIQRSSRRTREVISVQSTILYSSLSHTTHSREKRQNRRSLTLIHTCTHSLVWLRMAEYLLTFNGRSTSFSLESSHERVHSSLFDLMLIHEESWMTTRKNSGRKKEIKDQFISGKNSHFLSTSSDPSLFVLWFTRRVLFIVILNFSILPPSLTAHTCHDPLRSSSTLTIWKTRE